MTSSAELRFTRVMTAIVAGGSVMFGWLGAGAIARESSLAPSWWTYLAVAIVFGGPLVVAGIVLVAPLPVGRAANATGAALYLAVAGLSLVIVEDSPWSESAWILNNTALGTTMAALSVPRTAAWFYNGIVALLVVVERVHAAGGGAFAAVQHGLYSFAFCAVFMALAQLVIVQARRVDARTTRAARHAAEVEAIRARHTERARVDAVLHDTVLATLMLASRSDGPVDPELRRQAADAVAALETGPPDDGDGDVDPVQVLRERLARLDPLLSVTTSTGSHPLPRPIVDALVDAAVEAARNSLRHAELPLGQTPSVTLDQRPGWIRIIVADAGIGFAPSHVATGRLGLRSSIHGRLAHIPGATATVESHPGAGTRVELIWQNPE